MKIQNVVVGAGFAGACIARRIAEEKNESVLVIDKKMHIAGHAYDEYNEHGVLIHKYGPHIFHTNNKLVWNWLSRFTEWNNYQHRVLSYVDGFYVPMPISIETINSLYNLNLSTFELESWLDERRLKDLLIKNSEDVVLSKLGRDLFEKFFKNYTFKQWNLDANQLDASVISRIPVRHNRDTRYFSDRYQGLPTLGYTKLLSKILEHKNIHLLLNTEWSNIKPDLSYGKLFYTGSIDEYFDYSLGNLGYRSVKFEYETFFDREYFQKVGTVNYPNDYDFTRITEYKWLTGQKILQTTIAREFSSSEGEPFYTVPNASNQILYKEYTKMIPNNVFFIGRLAEYKYYNMDQIVERVLFLDI